MQVVILCGGKGTRAYPTTREIPKALMPIDGVPIVEQVMRIYAAQGFSRFILSCGYLKEAIIEYFDETPDGWEVTCVDSGDESDTGDRIWNLRHMLEATFMATYCDGLGEVDIHSLIRFHRSQGALATITSVPLRSQYGVIEPDGNGRVVGFTEKPVLSEYWINGGFFVFEEEVFKHWEGQNLEREVLPALARAECLHMYRHNGFWRSMDTYKDQQQLNELWRPYSLAFAAETREEAGKPLSTASDEPTPSSHRTDRRALNRSRNENSGGAGQRYGGQT